VHVLALVANRRRSLAAAVLFVSGLALFPGSGAR
jgi:hypothetical protein